MMAFVFFCLQAWQAMRRRFGLEASMFGEDYLFNYWKNHTLSTFSS